MAKVEPTDGWGPLRQRMDPPAKSRMQRRARGRQQDRAHLDLVRMLPCLITGQLGGVDAAHIRFSDAEHGKVNPGAAKPDDRWTVPLSHALHTDATEAQHRHGEEAWWQRKGISPLRVADNLYSLSKTLRDLKQPEDFIIRAMTAVIRDARNAAGLAHRSGS
ncbi:hypothetical protein [Azorhizobium doebereinerae]|uniref:hypothetical protein n=1 Tax=Azorhizobium doebereinerae TaxID=281091 RepID=UPI0012EBFF6F|nr:hypothetical protein [Azorhizobium doebereinerae]